MGRIKRIKKPRLHSEGRSTLQIGFVVLLLVNVLVYYGFHNISMIPFYVVASISVVLYAIVVNFFRCPIRIFDGETKNIAVAAADGKVVIETPQGQEVLVRQVAGAVARRIVTYAQRDEECYIDEHLGFIKFGSRVDVYLPLDSEILVKLGQATVGNQTIVARLSGK